MTLKPVADHEQWYWAIVNDIKCVGHWIRQPNGATGLIPAFVSPKRYAPPQSQKLFDDNNALYIEFTANAEDVNWGKPTTAQVVYAFLYDGLPHESEWLNENH